MHTQVGAGEVPGHGVVFLSQMLAEETHVSLGLLWSKTGPFSNSVEFLRIPAKS